MKTFCTRPEPVEPEITIEPTVEELAEIVYYLGQAPGNYALFDTLHELWKEATGRSDYPANPEYEGD